MAKYDKMDSIDKLLYKELSKNARATISELSAKVGLSMPAVSSRVKNLAENGYIGDFTITPGEKFKAAFPVAMQSMIKLNKTDMWEDFQEFLETHDYVTWYGTTTGHFDVIIHIVGKDTAHIEKIIREINSIPAVVDMESNLLLRQKNKYTANFL